MSILSNFLTSTKYLLSRKLEPVFNDYKKIITNFSELTPKMQDPYDLTGVQIYVSGPTNDGLFTSVRMTTEEVDYYYDQFIEYYTSIGVPIPTPLYEWEFKSQACNSYSLFRLDIYKPGRIVSKCTLPKYGWASVWLYISMNKGDFANPYLLPIDKPTEPREYYFEIDLFESMRNTFLQKDIFSGHYGTQTNRQKKTNNVIKSYDDKLHYCEVIWDGNGNWKWYLDSVCVHCANIPQPTEKVYPYLLLTLGLNTPIVPESDFVQWNVDYIKISDNLIDPFTKLKI
jgi:hypothetical protein